MLFTNRANPHDAPQTISTIVSNRIITAGSPMKSISVIAHILGVLLDALSSGTKVRVADALGWDWKEGN